METNSQNRNITISTKISAFQKVSFIKEAKKHNISLSEWVCSTLDLSINAYDGIKPLEQIRQLQEENRIKNEKIRKLYDRLETANLFIEINKSRKLSQAETISELKTENQLLSIKIEEIIKKNPVETENIDNKTAPINNNYTFISVAAFLLSLIVAGSVKN
jgi:hypothetical protein